MTDSEQEEPVSLENLPTTDTEEERTCFLFLFSEVMICNFMRITAKDVCSICLEELDLDTVFFEPSVSHHRLVLFSRVSPPIIGMRTCRAR